MVDLPEPLSPTKAMYYPLFILSDKLFRATVFEVGYLKVTFLNSISPSMFTFSPALSSTKGLY